MLKNYTIPKETQSSRFQANSALCERTKAEKMRIIPHSLLTNWNAHQFHMIAIGTDLRT